MKYENDDGNPQLSEEDEEQLKALRLFCLSQVKIATKPVLEVLLKHSLEIREVIQEVFSDYIKQEVQKAVEASQIEEHVESKMNKDRKLLYDMIDVLQDKIESLKNRLEQVEINDRLSVLIVDGVKFEKGVTLEQNIINAFEKHLGVPLEQDDFLLVLQIR